MSMFLAPKAHELPAHERVMARQKLAPGGVAQLRSALGRTDDVREQDRRQHTIRILDALLAGDELLDLIEDRVVVSDVKEVVAPR